MPLRSPSIHTTQHAALARDLSTQSGALTGRFAGGSSQPACSAMPTRTHRGRDSRESSQSGCARSELTGSRDPCEPIGQQMHMQRLRFSGIRRSVHIGVPNTTPLQTKP